MIFEDSFTVKAPIDRVWAFLRDPQRVAQCIPGTEKIEIIDDTHYHVVAGAPPTDQKISL
jgi:carbon monoxide dehydrogenase subunit G